MARVRAEIAEPHRQIAARTRQLAALSATVELLHAVIRFLKLMAKLREALAPGGDAAKAAKTLSEIATLRAEADLSGVACVEAALPLVARAHADVRGDATAALGRGLEALSQSDCGAALQVLFNLGELPQAAERCIAVAAKRAAAAAAEALDATKLGAAGAAGGVRAGAPPAGPRAQDALWQRLDAGLDKVRGSGSGGSPVCACAAAAPDARARPRRCTPPRWACGTCSACWPRSATP